MRITYLRFSFMPSTELSASRVFISFYLYSNLLRLVFSVSMTVIRDMLQIFLKNLNIEECKWLVQASTAERGLIQQHAASCLPFCMFVLCGLRYFTVQEPLRQAHDLQRRPGTEEYIRNTSFRRPREVTPAPWDLGLAFEERRLVDPPASSSSQEEGHIHYRMIAQKPEAQFSTYSEPHTPFSA